MDIALERIATLSRAGRLNLQHLGLTELPPLPDRVKRLICYGNNLTKLPELPTSLEELDCHNNQITEIPTLAPKLNYLNCSNNRVTKLPNLHEEVVEVRCDENEIESLPELPVDLFTLECSKNKLQSLPDLPKGLRILNCSHNKITSLPPLGPKLLYLQCQNNRLTVLPRLPNELASLQAYGNPYKEPFRRLIRNYSLSHSDEALNLLRNFIDEIYDLAKRGRNLRSVMEGLRTKSPSTPVFDIEYGPQSNIGSFISGTKGSFQQQMNTLKRRYKSLGEIPNAPVSALPYGPSNENFVGGKTRKRKSKKHLNKSRKRV